MSDIQDLKHRRGTGICYEQIVNERKISDTLERELNEAKAEIERLRIDNVSHEYSISELRMRIGLEPGGNYSEVVEAYERVTKERDEARRALREAVLFVGGYRHDQIALANARRWRKAAGLEES